MRKVAFLVLLGLVAFAATRRCVVPRGERAEAPRVAPRPDDSSAPLPATPTSAERQSVAPGQAAGVALRGAVVDASGPVVGAAVALTVLTAQDAEWEPTWQADEWGALPRERRATLSDAAGKFAFEGPLDAPWGAALSAAHTGHRTGLVTLPAERSQWPTEVRITLEATAAILVTVLDAEGRPVSGARVEQHGLAPGRVAPGDLEASELRARRFLAEEATTGPDGLVRLAALPGEQVLVASNGPTRSAPWRGPAREAVTLRLLPTFEVLGSLRLPDWSHLAYVGERRITIAAGEKNLWRTLHTLRDARGGEWGPIAVPLVASERYRVRLEGSPIVPVEVHFAPPEPGTRVRHDIVAELGDAIWAQVTDEDGVVLARAVVRAEWQDPVDPERWCFIERAPNPPGHVAENLVGLYSVPRGSVVIEASAPGYVTWRSGLIATETFVDGFMPIVLSEAARVRGRCLHRGEPVRDFEVLTWRTSERASFTSTRFFDREDGSFELDSAPVGDCWITACSGSLPGCDPRQIRASADGTTEVVLELPESIRGVGQVVDEETGEPLAGARLQLFVPGDVLPIARWGTPIPAGVDGVFELDGFRPGENQLRVLAPGYARRMVDGTGIPGEALDWGVIGLSRAHALTILLEDTTGVNDFDGIQVAARGPQPLPARTFSSSGEAKFEDVTAGTYELAITERDDTLTNVVAQVPPGRDHEIRHRIAGDNRLTIEVVGEEPPESSPLSAVTAHYVQADGSGVHRAIGPVTATSRSFELRGIEADHVQADVYDEQHETRASTSGTFSNGRLHLVLDVGGRPFLLDVVDADDRPIADAIVTLGDATRPGFLLFGSTDSSGRCELHGVPDTEVLVNLRHGERGTCLGIPVDGGAGRARLVLDARASIELLLEDEGLSLVGVACTIADPATGSAVFEGRTDAAGRIAIRALGEGPFTVSAERGDCWPAAVSVTARPEAALERVQMRRIGDLALEVFTQGGLPVSALPVELASIEFDADVATWISEDRVRSTGLVTDLAGRIVVEGLPRGAYRWSLHLPDGEQLDGQLDVAPGPAPPIRVTLPR